MTRVGRRCPLFAVLIALAACDGPGNAQPGTLAVTSRPSTSTPTATASIAGNDSDSEPADRSVPSSTTPANPGSSTTATPTTAATSSATATTIGIETDEGRLVVGADLDEVGELAPLPPDAAIDLVTTADTTTTVVATSPSSLDALVEFYVDAVERTGADALVIPVGDGVRRVEGQTVFGAMSTVLSDGPAGTVAITVQIVE